MRSFFRVLAKQPPPVALWSDHIIPWGAQIVAPVCRVQPIPWLADAECSADEWGELARIVLEAAYENTLYAAALNNDIRAIPTVFLTSIGGGAFGNPPEWITAAMDRAFSLAKDYGLDVRLVKRSRP